MHKLLQTLRFFSVSFFFVIYGHASVSSPLVLDINSSVNGTILTDSEISPHSNNRSEYYMFTLTQKKRIVISLESDFYYKFYLLESNGTIIQEATKYDYFHNKIVLTLSAGNYMVDVTSVFNDDYGAFTLSLKENIIETNPLTIESIIDGEWTENSAVSANTSQYANYYTFTLDTQTDILIDLDSYSPYIYLYDNNGSQIAYASGNSIDHAKIVKTLEAGEYTIELTNSGYYDVLGIYTLRFKRNIIETMPIDLNSTVSGIWGISSGVSPRSKRYTNYYTFTLDEAKDIVIGMENDIFAGKIYLLDSNNSVIAQSDGRRVVLQHLAEGTYTIDATLNYNYIGNFSIFLKENVIANTLIDLNSSLLGAWNQSSGISHVSGGYSDYYTFTLDEEKNIVISITGTNSILYLLDENGNRNYSISFINGSLVGVLDAGTYTVEVTQSIRKSENYQFEVYENRVENTEIRLGDLVSSSVVNSDGLSSETHNPAKEYTFTLSRKTNVVIDLNSSIYYAVALLKNDSRVLGHIVQRNVYTLEAGKYILEVTHYGTDDNVTNNFTLGLKENIIQTKPILFNTPTQGSWTKESGFTEFGYGYINQYTFSLTETTTVMIQMHSQYAKYIILDGQYYYSDDSDDILVSKTLDAGTYVIDVIINEFSNIYQTGDYTLLVQADIMQPFPINTLTTNIISAHSTTITWQHENNSTVGYKIYLNGVFVADVDGTENHYVLGGLYPENEYEYSVIAYNSAGESEAVSGTFKTKKDDYAWLVPVQYNILN